MKTRMNKEQEIRKIDSCIADLVYDKEQFKKAYNYYHCKRDAEQFRHIESNYGIGTPTSVGFTPLIKKHIDVLVGEYLELEPDLQISCKDDNTISDIMRDKELAIYNEQFKYFKSKLENAIIKTMLESKEPVSDPYFEQQLDKIKKDVSSNYVSQYEKAAQNILNYIKNSRDIDISNKMKELLTDLLIVGVCYYRVRTTKDKKNINFEALNTCDTFIERNKNSYYLNKSPRAVVRRYLTAEQIFKDYGDELTEEEKSSLENKTYKEDSRGTGSMIYSTTLSSDLLDNGIKIRYPGLLGGLESIPNNEFSSDSIPYNQNYITVYECEWIEYDGDKLTRHEGIKIGGDIYIARGESENIVRSVSNPKDCSLSVNGIFFNDKNGDPFSLMLSTMDLQDWLNGSV